VQNSEIKKDVLDATYFVAVHAASVTNGGIVSNKAFGLEYAKAYEFYSTHANKKLNALLSQKYHETIQQPSNNTFP
jgi:hypothetical protein